MIQAKIAGVAFHKFVLIDHKAKCPCSFFRSAEKHRLFKFVLKFISYCINIKSTQSLIPPLILLGDTLIFLVPAAVILKIFLSFFRCVLVIAIKPPVLLLTPKEMCEHSLCDKFREPAENVSYAVQSQMFAH